MSHTSTPRQTVIRITLVAIAMVLFLMWIEGAFEPKTAPGITQTQAQKSQDSQTVRVELRDTDEILNWPGTVAALTVTQVAPKIPGRILDITVRAGNSVKRGQVLVRLDTGEIQAKLGQARAALNASEAEALQIRAQTEEIHSRLEQARGALAAAEAGAYRTRADATRIENLFHQEAATHQDLDAAQAAAKEAAARVTQAQNAVHEIESHLKDTLPAATRAADSQVARAREGLREAESHLSDTVLVAPFDSVVVTRHQEPGDMALPGTSILTLQQSQHLRIEAAIPAHCAGRIAVGAQLTARLADTSQDIRVVVDEIQPSTDPATRTVLVKARLPDRSGAQPGSFASLQQACGQAPTLLIPAKAVSRIGQLESVQLIIEGQRKLRHIRTGKHFGEAVEVLSGLNAGDVVAIPGDR